MTARDHVLPSGSVMNVNEINAGGCHPEIARVRNVAGAGDAICRLDGCIAHLVQTDAAKVALAAAPQLICMPPFRAAKARNEA
jgi:hypothetical protein